LIRGMFQDKSTAHVSMIICLVECARKVTWDKPGALEFVD
jgi:hypothetical protein